MTTLTLAKLVEIEAAAAKATPGPWRNTGVKGEGDGAHFAVGSPSGIVAVVHGSTVTEVCNTRDMISQCDPATVAALCRDARRYQYLRSRDSSFVLSTDGPEAGVWCDCESASGELQLLTERDLDDAIDDAIRAAGLIEP